MTDQLTPLDNEGPDSAPAFAPPTRLDKAKSEIMAGGAVSERAEDEVAGGWQGLLAMAGIVALFVWLATVNIWIFVFVVGVVISIFLHELGHYMTARWTGMKVTQFFLFFGPRLWSFRRGETEYGVRALPLGAFVRIIGMNRMDEVDPADEGRTYRQATFPRRLLVISAGSIMHILIAIVLLFVVYSTQGELTAQDEPEVIVAAVSPGLPAMNAGIRDGDRIVSIAGAGVTSPEELGVAVRSHEPGTVVPVVVIRDGETVTIPVGLGSNNSVPSDDELFGTALLGVRSYSPPHYQDHSARLGGSERGHRHRPRLVGVDEGHREGAQPRQHGRSPHGHERRPRNPPDHVVRRSDGVRRRRRVRWDDGRALHARRAQRVRRRVQHDAAAAARRWARRDRGVRTHPGASPAHAQRYFADVERLMPFAMGVIAVLAMLMFTGLYLDITQPIG